MTDNHTRDDPHSQTKEDVADTDLAKKIILALIIILAAWGAAIFKWGIPGLYIPALASVPLIYLILIIVARG